MLYEAKIVVIECKNLEKRNVSSTLPVRKIAVEISLKNVSRSGINYYYRKDGEL